MYSHILWPNVWWLCCHSHINSQVCVLDMFVFKYVGPRNCYTHIYVYIYICMSLFALYVAWFRNYMQCITVNKVMKDVDCYRFMTAWHSWISWVTSSGCQLGSLIIGGLLPLTLYLCNCMWKLSEAYILWPFCEGFGQPHDFNNRVIFMAVCSMYCICHLWVIGSYVWGVFSISHYCCFVGWDSTVGIATCYGPARGVAFTTHPCLLLKLKKV